MDHRARNKDLESGGMELYLSSGYHRDHTTDLQVCFLKMFVSLLCILVPIRILKNWISFRDKMGKAEQEREILQQPLPGHWKLLQAEGRDEQKSLKVTSEPRQLTRLVTWK